MKGKEERRVDAFFILPFPFFFAGELAVSFFVLKGLETLASGAAALGA